MGDAGGIDEDNIPDDIDEDNIAEDVTDLVEAHAAVELFSRPAVVRILVVLESQISDLPVGSIADKAGVSRSAVYDNLDTLKELDLVEESREDRGVTYYRMKENDTTRAWREFTMYLSGIGFLIDT